MEFQSEKKQNEKMAMTIGIILIIVVALVTFFRPSSQKKTVDVSESESEVILPTISAKILQQKLDQGSILHLIDVREQNDFLQEHLPSSINIPIGSLSESKLDSTKDELIVIVGYSADQSEASAQSVEILKKKGFSNINILLGGIDIWKSGQGKTISLGNPSSLTDQSKVMYISTDELKNIFDNNLASSVYILDIRSQSSFRQSHIQGAINIPILEIEKRVKEIPQRKMIIVYAENQAQGFQGGVLLYDLDFLTAKVVKGGLVEWKQKNFPTVSE
jgi:rhodanese-related sulfurtransferase